jgi:hypothetical protein
MVPILVYHYLFAVCALLVSLVIFPFAGGFFCMRLTQQIRKPLVYLKNSAFGVSNLSFCLGLLLIFFCILAISSIGNFNEIK